MLIHVPRDDFDLAVDARARYRDSLTPAESGLMLHIVCAFLLGEELHASRLQEARRIFAIVRSPIAYERAREPS